MIRPAPYVVGQWVRGERFYGRRQLLAMLFADDRRATWVDGLRRMGKTSLLREVELEASADGGATVPLFCDLQGVDSAAELELCVADAIAEGADLLASRGCTIEQRTGESPLTTLQRIGRALDERGCALWLLCDEVDEAAGFESNLLAGLGELWQVALSRRRGRLLIASSARLAHLADQREELGRLLALCGAPVHLGVLEGAEALDLLRQSKARAAEQPALEGATAQVMLEAAGGHPMLLQMVAKRWWESGDPSEAIRRLDSEHALEQLFAADWRLLIDDERNRLRALAAGDRDPRANPRATTPDPVLERLAALGLVRRGEEPFLRLANGFLGSWIRRLPSGL